MVELFILTLSFWVNTVKEIRKKINYVITFEFVIFVDTEQLKYMKTEEKRKKEHFIYYGEGFVFVWLRFVNKLYMILFFFLVLFFVKFYCE